MAEITKELGRIPVSRGGYQATIEYYKDNIVQYKRGSYQVVSESPIIGVPPTDDKNVVNPGWTLFAGTLDAQDVVNQVKDQETKSIQAIADREAEILAKSDASEVSFDNTGTSLSETNVQNALVETDGKVTELDEKIAINDCGKIVESNIVNDVYMPVTKRKGTYYIIVSSLHDISNSYLALSSERSKSSVTTKILDNETLKSGENIYKVQFNNESYIRFSVNDSASYTEDVSFVIKTTIAGEIEEIKSDIETKASSKDLDNMSELLTPFVVRTKQLFDKNNPIIVKGLYARSSDKTIVSNGKSYMFVIEKDNLNGKYIGMYINSNIKQYISNIVFFPFVSNVYPAINEHFTIEFSGSVTSDYVRSRGLVTKDSRYICLAFQINSDDAELVNKTVDIIKDNLIVVVQDTQPEYPIPYSPYISLDIKPSEDFVEKNQGIENAGKILVVGSDGFVGYEEKKSEDAVTLDDVVVKKGLKTYFLGKNLLTDASVVPVDGWSGNVSNGISHTSGTEPISFNVVTEEGVKYIFTCTSNKAAEDAVLVTLGDFPWTDVYNGTTFFRVGFYGNGGMLKIKTISSSYAVSLSNIKLQKIVDETESVESITFDMNNVESGVMDSNIDGWWNVAIAPDSNDGIKTLGRNVNGRSNIAIGGKAMSYLRSGTRNIAIGTYTMPKIDEGDRNVAIGADVIYDTNNISHRTAYDNVAIGKACMQSGATLTKNVAVGGSAMGNNQDGASQNVCIGYQSGNYANKNNTNIGCRAGYFQRGSNNVAVGYGSGTSSSANNTNNTIAIGYQAEATKSNQMVLGNPDITEVIIAGKKIIFHDDGSVTWTAL